MIYNERTTRTERIKSVMGLLMNAARTAPKAKGLDLIEVATLMGNDLELLADEMQAKARETGRASYDRDGNNVRHADAVLIIGTQKEVLGLNCAHCGFDTCNSKPDNVPCAFNSIDVGIALGSACSIAADLRVDTRVMFTAGLVAQENQLLGPSIYNTIAIAVSVSSKNPFFDRAK